MMNKKIASDAWRAKLRVLLRGRGMTISTLSQAVGCSQSIISKWLAGGGISYPAACLVAAALGVSVLEFLSPDPLSPDTMASFFRGEKDQGATALPTQYISQPVPQPDEPVIQSAPAPEATQPPEEEVGVLPSEDLRQKLHQQIDALYDAELHEAATALAEWHFGWMRKLTARSSGQDRRAI